MITTEEKLTDRQKSIVRLAEIKEKMKSISLKTITLNDENNTVIQVKTHRNVKEVKRKFRNRHKTWK